MPAQIPTQPQLQSLGDEINYAAFTPRDLISDLNVQSGVLGPQGIRYAQTLNNPYVTVQGTSMARVRPQRISKANCAKCTKEFNANLMTIITAGKFCKDCFRQFYFQCYRCTEYIDIQKIKLFITDRGYRVCEPCKDRYHTNCASCNVITNVNDLIKIEDSMLCQDCARRYCFHCDFCDFTLRGKAFGLADGCLVCRECYLKNFYFCWSCRTVKRISYQRKGTCTPCGYLYCLNCYVEHNCISKGKPRISSEERLARKESQEKTWMEFNKKAMAQYYQNNPYRPPSYKHFPGDMPGKIVTVKRLAGIEIEAEQGNLRGLAEILPDEIGIGRDGSIQGVEVQTPPTSMNTLETFVEKTCQALVSKGYKGTKKAGLHVHIDATDFQKDHQKIIQVIKTFYSIEDIMFSMLPPSRWANTYCKRLNKDYLYKTFRKSIKFEDIAKKWYGEDNDIRVEEVKRRKYQETRYHSLNIHSLFYRGTVEIRCHSGTVSAKKILFWTQLMLEIVDYAVNRYDEKQVEHLFNLPTSSDKLRIMSSYFHLSDMLTIYVSERTAKFNPGFVVKFNKGREKREKENSQSSRVIREYNKKLEKAKIDLLPQIKKDIQGEYSWATTSNGIDWEMPEIKAHIESLLENRAQQKVLETFPEAQRHIVFHKGEKGFMEEEELNEILRHINIGKSMANANHESTDDFEE